jgi:hypothetical protein
MTKNGFLSSQHLLTSFAFVVLIFANSGDRQRVHHRVAYVYSGITVGSRHVGIVNSCAGRTCKLEFTILCTMTCICFYLQLRVEHADFK